MKRVTGRPSSEAGFSLIETMVALAIAMVMFAALGAVSIAGVHSVVLSRQNQQAADVLNKAIEDARSVSFANLTMKSTDPTVAADPAITGSPAVYDLPGAVPAEAVDLAAVGAVAPHETTVSPDGKVQFTLRRYVTVPASATYDVSGFPSVRRFTAVVSWSSYGKSHTRSSSAIITDTRRGLPLPNYLMQALEPTSQTKSLSTSVDYAFSLRNNGARDAFNIRASAGTWRYYVDLNANGVLDTAENDPANELGNWDAATGNTEIDTGQLNPNTTIRFIAHMDDVGTTLGSESYTFTTVSAAQPLADGAEKSVSVNLTVTDGSVSTPPPSGSCPGTPSGAVPTGGTTLTSFYFLNRPAGNTTTQVKNPLARADCTVQASNFDYSTEDLGRSLGRVIRPGGTAGNDAQTVAAEWRYQVAADTIVSGTAVVTFPFKCTSNTGPVSSGSVAFTAMVGTRNNDNTNLSGFSQYAAASTATLACPASGWAMVTLPVSFPSAMSVNANKWIAVRLVTVAGSSPVLVNYDAPAAQSFISLPVAP